MREMFENFDIFDIRGILLIVEKKREKSKSNLTQVFLVKKIVKNAITHKIVTSESCSSRENCSSSKHKISRRINNTSNRDKKIIEAFLTFYLNLFLKYMEIEVANNPKVRRIASETICIPNMYIHKMHIHILTTT